MKILVTGGAGFIGSNVADEYIRAGHDVFIMDNLSTGKAENINKKAEFYKADIRSNEAGKIINEIKPDVINHHAAQMSVPESVKDPTFDCEVNLLGLINIMENVKDKDWFKKIIFISSGGSVYGEASNLPCREDSPLMPLSPYAITKKTSEDYLRYYKHQYNVDYSVLRYGNVFGPRQVPHGEAGVVAIFINNILNGRKSSLYNYDDEPKGMTRDYCYISDIVEANLLVLDKGENSIYNISSGVETHTLDLYNNVYDEIKKIKPETSDELRELNRGPARDGDLKRSLLNCEKAGKELLWQTKTDLSSGISETVKWAMNK